MKDERGGVIDRRGKPRAREQGLRWLQTQGAVTVDCQECGVELAGDSPELRLMLTCDDEPIVYCVECWERSSARVRAADEQPTGVADRAAGGSSSNRPLFPQPCRSSG